jgi:2-polyprenyl-3-methyl-5-hydroxy-6-metoxy-1,4-benzoquinol methylase
MTIKTLLSAVEHTIQTSEEHAYFLTHEARYAYILQRCIDATMQQRDTGSPSHRLAVSSSLRILDVGCYPYHLGYALEQLGHDVYGIASAHEPIRSANVKVCNIETDKLPFKDNFFDMIICTEVLEHLPQSPAYALREMHRVTKKNGHLLVTTPNIARSISRIRLLLGKSVTYPLSLVLEDSGRGSNIYHRHNREYTLDELQTLIEFAGWNTQEASYFISYTPTRRRMKPDSLPLKIVKWINYTLMKILPSWQDTLLVIGAK